MELLFSTTVAIDDAKITDTDFKDKYPTISSNTYWASYKPYVEQATIAYLLPLLGETFYDEIVAGTSPQLLKLQDMLKGAVAFYSVFDAMPHFNIELGEAGVQQNIVANNQPTSLWAFNQGRWSALINGERQMARAMKYIVDNIDDMGDFKDSPEYCKSVTEYFTYDIFSTFTQVETFPTYLALVPYIKNAKDIVLDEQCGTQIATTLAASIGATPDDKDTELIKRVRMAMAYRALMLAIPELNVYKDKNAVMVISSIDGLENSRIGVFSRDNEKAISNLMAQYKENYDRAMRRITEYLYANKDHFTEFADTLATATVSSKITALPNCKGSIIL